MSQGALEPEKEESSIFSAAQENLITSEQFWWFRKDGNPSRWFLDTWIQWYCNHNASLSPFKSPL